MASEIETETGAYYFVRHWKMNKNKYIITSVSINVYMYACGERKIDTLKERERERKKERESVCVCVR